MTRSRVLVVEDDPAVLGMLELLLATEGYETESVLDGSAAMRRLDGPATDLVLLDVMMPGVDGFAVLRAMRTSATWMQTPVVVVSACGTDEDLWTGWQSGADYYLTKPFDLDELREVTVALLAGRPPSAASLRRDALS